MIEPGRLLVTNALLQITFSAWFGVWLLYRLHVAARRNGARDLVAAHVDWIVLGLMQVAVAYGLERLRLDVAALPAILIAIAGWLNPVPYLARGVGVNAFQYGGSVAQRVLALLGAASVISLVAGLSWVTVAAVSA